jgi:hypothetical protein
MKTFTYNTHFYGDPEFQATIAAPEDSEFLVIVHAENGDKIVKPYSYRNAANRGLDYYLRKYDKKNLGASGNYYKLSEVAA